MTWFRLIIELTALMLGVGYLYSKHLQRVRSSTPPEVPGNWTGHGIETSELKPRVEQMRRDYLAGRQGRKGVCFHRYLLGLARRAVMRLGYFRHGEPGKHAHDHSPS
jgi:hypothetical protein